MSESNPLASSDISDKSEKKSANSAGVFARRTVVAGAVWSVPAVMLAQSASAVSISCFPVGTVFQAVARGRLLSGFLGGVNLDNVAGVSGVTATAPASGPNPPDPVVVTGGVNATVLNGIAVNATGLTGTLSSLLTLAAPAGVGTLNQYAEASTTGTVRGASGAITNAGQLALTPTSGSYPDFGTVNLQAILAAVGRPDLSDLLTNVAGLTLQIGAVTGRAALQSACVPGSDNLQRDYQITRLNLVLTSTALTALVTAVRNALALIEDIRVATVAVVTVDVAAILAGNLPGGGQPIQASLGTTPATLTIDLASLLGPAPGQPGSTQFGSYSAFLNNLPPNSTLLVDSGLGVPAAALTAFTTTLVTVLTQRLRENIRIFGTPLNSPDVAASVLTLVLNVLNPLLAALPALVGAVVTTAITPVFTALRDVIQIDVNAQNRSTNPTGPAALEALPVGRYDVAALYIRAVGLVNLLDLFIARGSVGPNVRTG
ncbi:MULTISPECIES: choice-of-anchor G family protein [unclassified Rathayibacter]|uniref:choice-of-anchor G family protein n=1 Tax=unclassified Rathayibacter TaxID=2609250 RepID=UPI0011B0CD42|nr:MULTISPECIES: choice-of-anchor G family protein [unclassified Rathayibacter]